MGQPSVKTNHFNEDLSYSIKASEESFWEQIYRKAFPNFVSMMGCPGDFESQRMGIDRVILLSNGLTLKIDEKKRRDDRTDILLEYLSNDKTGAPGWIEKDLAIHYLAYAFMPSKQCYLFDWPMLRAAWIHWGETRWKKIYSIPPAHNTGYDTYSVAIPISELRNAMSQVRHIQL